MKIEAIRVLERLGIPHRMQKFAPSRLSAEEAADALGVPLAAIVKTIVLVGDRTGGMRGLQIELSPHALVRAANAAVADLTETA